MQRLLTTLYRQQADSPNLGTNANLVFVFVNVFVFVCVFLYLYVYLYKRLESATAPNDSV